MRCIGYVDPDFHYFGLLGEIASLGDETIRRGYYLRLLGEIVSKVFITLAGEPTATQ